MRIALPVENNEISGHFGHCEYFKVLTVENGKISKEEKIDNVENHQPGVIPTLLKENDINIVIAGGIGQKAIQFFNNWGIDVIPGITGSVDTAIQMYLDGTIKAGTNGCSH